MMGLCLLMTVGSIHRGRMFNVLKLRLDNLAWLVTNETGIGRGVCESVLYNDRELFAREICTAKENYCENFCTTI